MGNEVKLFENELTNFLKDQHMCKLSTAALHLALQACSIKKGDEVLVSAVTYLATFQAITATGAKPVLCDNLEDLNISLQSIKKNFTKKDQSDNTCSFLGHPCELKKFMNCKKKEIRSHRRLAHAFGSFYKNKNRKYR